MKIKVKNMKDNRIKNNSKNVGLVYHFLVGNENRVYKENVDIRRETLSSY